MTLHLLKNSPHGNTIFNNCLNALETGDALLLIEDGVYATLKTYKLHTKVKSDINIYAMSPDLLARGLIGQLTPLVKPVDYLGFVTLTEEHSKIITW